MEQLLIKTIFNYITVTLTSILEHELLSTSANAQKFTINILKTADKIEMQNLRHTYKEKRKEGRKREGYKLIIVQNLKSTVKREIVSFC